LIVTNALLLIAARASAEARKAMSDHTTKITVAPIPSVIQTFLIRAQSRFDVIDSVRLYA
jgi:hypothetical protein